jgi:hypothetical protein
MENIQVAAGSPQILLKPTRSFSLFRSALVGGQDIATSLRWIQVRDDCRRDTFLHLKERFMRAQSFRQVKQIKSR